MNVFARFLGFVLSLFGFGTRRGRPAFPVRADSVGGQLDAGTIYRLMRDRTQGPLAA